MNRHRVAIVTGIPAPYREPVFAELARRPGIELKVFYCAAGHSNVAWEGSSAAYEYDREFLPNWTPKKYQRLPMFGYANTAIRQRLKQFDPNYVIVYGYNQLTHWMTFRYCLAQQVPF